jgi:hypothetical protein
MVKVLVGAVLVIAVVVIGGVIAFFIGGHSKHTDCFAAFGSSVAAEVAAAQGRTAGFDVIDQPGGGEGALIFETGKTGDDAIPLQESFARIVRQNHGQFGHPQGGCLEKQAID